MKPDVLNIAHRGASEHLPDNTIASFDQALLENADMIEFDIRKTADGEIVLFHDWYAGINFNEKPNLNYPRLVSHLAFKDLAHFCENNGFRLATLSEVLNRYGNRIDLNIELKAGGYEKEVVDLLYKFNMNGRVVLSSFFPWVIKKIKDIDPKIKTGWIIGQEQVILLNRLARPMVSLLFKNLQAESAHLHYEIITPAIIQHFHSRRIPIYAWTVNEIGIMQMLIKMGIDGIITNRPGTLDSVLNEKKTAPIKSHITNLDLADSGKAR
jgi:glycerophosphoryl diester phosphodiesterase